MKKVVSQRFLNHKILFGAALFACAVLVSSFVFSYVFISETPVEDSSAKTVDLSVKINTSISLTLSKTSVDISLNPTATGVFAYDTLAAVVSTNGSTGYTLSMNTKTEDTALAHASTEDSIPSITADTSVTDASQANFAVNSWGYAVASALASGGTTFHKVPALSTPDIIKETAAPGSNDTTNVAFATRADMTVSSGTYTNTVVFSAVTNFVPEPGITFEEAYRIAGKTKILGADAYYYAMQDMNQAICDAVSTPDKTVINVPEITLIDTRDNEVYTVRKLADGNCWMSQNLRLKLTANTPLTSADTDVSSNFTPTLSTQPTSENTTSWGAYSNASDVNKSRSYDTGNRDYGTYYNWFTATAGTGLYNNTTTNAASSICPKGWQLPQVTGTKSYYNLITTTYGLASSAAGSTTLQSAPLSFPLSGYYDYDGSVRNQGFYGNFWSATPYSTPYLADYLYFTSSLILQYANAKAYGYSVRCVARDDPKPDNTSELTQALADSGAEFEQAADGKMYYKMQQPANQIATACANTTTPAKTVTNPPEATLIDTRDKELYTVRKLADGNCWMSQNLRIANKTLTPADSDVSSNFTLPAAQTTAFTNTADNNQVGAISSDPAHGGGAYYSWYTATAGTGTAAMSTRNQKATSSICPKGWQLPEGGASTTKSFNNLITTTYGIVSSAAGSTTLQAQPLQFVLAGLYDTSGFVNGGSDGLYWSSSVYNASLAYTLYLYSSGVSPQNYLNKYNGYSVRCVSR